jgi:hypothetical protein
MTRQRSLLKLKGGYPGVGCVAENLRSRLCIMAFCVKLGRQHRLYHDCKLAPEHSSCPSRKHATMWHHQYHICHAVPTKAGRASGYWLQTRDTLSCCPRTTWNGRMPKLNTRLPGFMQTTGPPFQLSRSVVCTALI